MKNRIELIRDNLKNRKLDAYIIPTNDPHFSEEIADHWKCFEWLSELEDLVGAFGSIALTKEKAALWVDPRYHNVNKDELKVKGIDLKKLRVENEPTDVEWVIKNLNPGETCGINGKLYSVNQVRKIKELLNKNKINLNTEVDIFDEVWKDRPFMPKGKVFIHDIKYCGKSSSDKILDIKNEMKKYDADYYLISALNDIAWITNLRGNDSKNSPLFYSYFLVGKDENILFVNHKKIDKKIIDNLSKENISIEEYSNVFSYLSKIKDNKKVLLDPKKTNYLTYNSIGKNANKCEINDITLRLKAKKNEVEIKNFKNCLIKDGIAMVKFLYWLKNSIGKEKITELTVEEKLLNLRKQQPLNRGLSFDTVSAYKEHAAKCHYKANEKNNYELKKEGMLLVDSGGQYLDGTTDITRTIVLGNITDEERRDYTLVLKALIGTANTYFRESIVGANLDIAGRSHLYKYGIEHLKGSCHGIGFYLSVHEFPPAIGLYGVPYSDMEIEENMVMSNEPGVYKEDRHGIRLENMQYVEKHIETEYGKFYKFTQLTMCPFDLEGIDVSLLNDEEKKWVNDYHKQVFETLSPYLDKNEKEWLFKETNKV